MEKEMLKLFIYYMFAYGKEGTKDYCLTGCIKQMDKALDIIRKGSYNAWNEIIEKLPENHPVLKEQKKLMSLQQEQYEQALIKSKKLMEKYCLLGGTLNYDSLYLISSEKDVERLVYQVILKNKNTATIKEIIEEKSKNQDINREELAILIDELCIRYYYGDGTEKNYSEAVKGWEMVYDYINDAKYMLAICYKKGTGVNQDKEKAYQIFNEISKVDIRAKYQIAIMNFIGVGTVQNYVKAFEIFSELKGKSPWDMDKWIDSYMGEMYFYGLGVEQDKEKGLSLMENAWNERIALDYKNIKKVLKDYYNS